MKSGFVFRLIWNYIANSFRNASSVVPIKAMSRSEISFEWIIGFAMRRKREHIWIVLKNFSRSIPLMHV
jgi:hypothetical protein